MKHLRSKLIIIICLLVCVPLLLLGITSIRLNVNTTEETLEQTMTEAAELAAGSVGQRLRTLQVVTAETGKIARLSDPAMSDEEKLKIITEKAESYGFNRGTLVYKDGVGVMEGDMHLDMEYFKRAMSGNAYISSPAPDGRDGEMVITLSAPMWKDGIAGTTVEGVILFEIPAEFLVNIVKDITVSPNAAAQIINSEGTIVAHPDMARVNNMHNSMKLAASDPSLAKIAELERLQTLGENGFDTYEMGGVEKFLAYAPIPNTDGWSIGVNAPSSDFMQASQQSIQITIGIIAACLVLSVIISTAVAGNISKPISRCAQRLSSLAQGNLSDPVPKTKAKDETGVLLRSLDTCVTELKGIISDVSYHLGEISNGNLTTTVEKEYQGDFEDIHKSLKRIISSLRELIGDVVTATTEVNTACTEIASASQSLAQSTTQGAQNTEQLEHAVNIIAEHTRDTAEHVRKATDLGREMNTAARQTDMQMGEMINAVQEIQTASHSIEKVMKEIDSIAFQTNILSLNAAVEAARAGVNGKGFAVVADEVRSLALKCSDAAKETAVLITDTIEKSQNGYRISQETSKSLETIVQGIQDTSETLEQISDGTKKQTEEIVHINTAIEEEVKAVQMNSATSEQTAAASEQISAQSRELLSLVSHFRVEGETKKIG